MRIKILAGLGSAAVAVLLMACSGGSDEPAPTPPSSGSTTTAPAATLRLMPRSGAELGAPSVPAATASTASGAAPLASVTTPYGAFGTTAVPGQFPRTVKHAMGETTIARAPQRVIALDTGEIDALVQLGIQPVGVADYGATGLPPYLRTALPPNVTLLGSVAEPNLELLASLRPDLILSSRLRHEKIYPLLSQIAPTVFTDRPGVTFRENLRLYAQATGKEEAAATVVKKYEDSLTRLNKGLPSPRPNVAIVQMRSNTLRFYQRANFLGTILTDLGFPRPGPQNVDDFAQDLGLERLGEYGAGDMIVLAIQGTENPYATDAQKSPLWLNLPAVVAKKVLSVDDQTWIGGVGYGAAFVILDGLGQYFGVR